MKSTLIGIVVLVLLSASLAGPALGQNSNSNGNNSNTGNTNSPNQNSGNANVAPYSPPPPILNTYGLLLPGVTDDQVKSITSACAQQFLAGQKPPPGFTYDDWGRLIGSSKTASTRAVPGMGIDGYRDPTEFWLSQSSVRDCVTKSLTSGTNPSSSSGPNSQSGVNTPAKMPENVPFLNSNEPGASESSANRNSP